MLNKANKKKIRYKPVAERIKSCYIFTKAIAMDSRGNGWMLHIMKEALLLPVREYLETVLAPRIQGDGGWVEFESLDGDRLTLVFRGECSKCEILDRCEAWIGQKIREDLGQTVQVCAVRKKPFFWDK